MENKDLAGKQVIPGSWPAIKVGSKGEYRLDPIHASWRFPAVRESTRTEHSHGVFHFLLVSEGTGSFMVAGEVLPVVAPMLFLISPEVAHVFSTTRDQALVYHEFTFTLRGQGAPKTWKELLDHCHPGLCSCACTAMVFHPGSELAGRIDTILLGLTAVLSGRTHEAFLDTYVRMLFTLAAEALFEGTDAGSGMCREEEDYVTDPLAVVMTYMEQHAIERFTLTLLAGMAGLSEKHLCRAFKKRFGTTLFKVKRENVLKSAERLLVSTRYPLKQIAQMTGFLDEYHFSKAFRRHFGQPPGRYRNIPG
ncbi:MAG: hypothetical protein A3J97_12610 [Spirochaetes bacterium RIFOXYC1_FULL_54_7]|nr:MAG: hypothetical protein A3J97_12610 [Spirochaetes bacterium RIFOXYC1_FULL_54_7]